MNTKIHIYLKAIILTALYYLILNGTTLILFKTINTDFFDSDIKIQIVDLIPVVLTLSLVVLIFKKGLNKNKTVSIKPINLLSIIVLVFAIRLFNDPVYRFSELLNYSEIPKETFQSNFKLNTQIFFMLKIMLFVPVLEEIFFRGVILNLFFKKNKNVLISLLISSLLFASIHFNPISINYITIITAFSFGIVAGLIYLRYGLLYASIFHMFHNTLWLVIKENRNQYWDILKELNFGVQYWIIIIISLSIIIIFAKKELVCNNDKKTT